MRMNAPCIRALATPRSARATMPGRSVLLAESAKVSAAPSANSAARTMRMLTLPVTIVVTRTASTSARATLTTTTIRLRLKRSAATPPNRPNSSTGRYSLSAAIEMRNGSPVSE